MLSFVFFNFLTVLCVAKASGPAITPCYLSGFRLNLKSLTAVTLDSMEYAKQWKADCACELRAKANLMFATSILRALILYKGANFYFDAPISAPVVPTIGCSWKDLKEGYDSSLKSLAKASVILDRIEMFECKGLNSTILQSQYNLELDTFQAIIVAISESFDRCVASCDRILSQQIATPCQPCCNLSDVLKWGVEEMRPQLKRSKLAYQMASPQACNCCWEKAARALESSQLLQVVSEEYQRLRNMIPATKLDPLSADKMTRLDCKEYECHLYARWASNQVGYNDAFASLDYLYQAADFVVSCPSSKIFILPVTELRLELFTAACESLFAYYESMKFSCQG